MKIEMLLTEDPEHRLRHVVIRACGHKDESVHLVPIVDLLTNALKASGEAIFRYHPRLEQGCDESDFESDTVLYSARSRFSVRL